LDTRNGMDRCQHSGDRGQLPNATTTSVMDDDISNYAGGPYPTGTCLPTLTGVMTVNYNFINGSAINGTHHTGPTGPPTWRRMAPGSHSPSRRSSPLPRKAPEPGTPRS